MTSEEKLDLLRAIDEFYDNAFHQSLKSEISEKAKAIALKAMIDKLNSSVFTGMDAQKVLEECGKPTSEKAKLGEKKVIDYFKNKSVD